MKLFQNSAGYPLYNALLAKRLRGVSAFDKQIEIILEDRFGAPHILLPVLDRDRDAFYTNGDNEGLQRLWARRQGLPAKAGLEEILLAQIEAHGTEVFYNLDPMRYGSDFVRRLPGCVRHTLCWRAAPSPGGDFSAYGLVLCNFPDILASYREQGWRAAYFTPGHDPAMDVYAANDDRPIDVLFIGGYSRHHRRRARILDSVAGLASEYRVSYHLHRSRLTRLADSPLGLLPPFSRHRLPAAVGMLAKDPLFGRDLYREFSRAKIVLNVAIDMAGQDRGNMRCFESLGCAALMVSDSGVYPEGFNPGETMMIYDDPEATTAVLTRTLRDWSQGKNIARQGYEMVRERYSKARQWKNFLDLLQ